MKKIVLMTLCLLFSLFLITACGGESGDLLYSEEHDGLTYCVRGDGTEAEQLVVKQGETVLWCEDVDVSEEIGNYKGTFGFCADDLNFDGYRDLAIATDVSGDCYTYSCFLYDPTTQDYLPSAELNKLYNVKADASLKAVFGFTHTQNTDKAQQDSSTPTDTATMYEWVGGKLLPLMRASFTYYPESNLYLYSVAYYNTQTQAFEDDYGKEDWMTPEEYNEADKSVVFYFK